MKLCDRDIEILLNNGKLIITPRPLIQRINGATVDICLGNKFRTFLGYNAGFIDLGGLTNNISKVLDDIMSDEIILSDKETFFLHPNELVLAITLESITIPNNLIGWLDGRSSLARLGLMVHATSHRVDPGWNGNLVLEFYNAGKLPLALRPGMIIGALSFEPLSGPAERPYNLRKNAKYKIQNGTISSRIDQED